jgi:uncharacterized protein (TIGR03086 family)
MIRTDPRPLQARCFAQARDAVAAVRPEHMSLPTPCTEFDVRTLLGHMVAVFHRVAAAGRAEDLSVMPTVVEGVADDGWLAAYDAGVAEVRSVWADDSLLDREITLPFATLPGTAVVSIYAQELCIHGWDLAVAVGAPVAWDPEVAEALLPVAHAILPPQPRGAAIGGAFAEVVEVPETAGAYTRLAGWLGRDPGRWGA